MRGFLFFVALLLLIGCKSTKHVTQQARTDSTGSSNNTVVEYIKTIDTVIQPDSALIEALIECQKKGDKYVPVIKAVTKIESGRNTMPSIGMRNDSIIYLECDVDSFLVYSQFKLKYETATQTVTEKKDSSFELYKKKSTPILSVIGLVVIIGGLIYAVFKLAKKFKWF